MNCMAEESRQAKLSTLCLLLFSGVAAGFSFGGAFDAGLEHQSVRMLINLLVGAVNLVVAAMNIALARAGM